MTDSLRSCTVRTLLVALIGVVGGSACKKNKPEHVEPAAAASLEAPRELLGYLSVRGPMKVLDDGLNLIRRFVPLKVDSGSLIDGLLARARIDRSLVESLDLSGTVWLIGFDDERLKERDATLMVLPIRSRQQLLAALGRRMERKGRDGELIIFRPKPGHAGLTEVRIWVGDRLAIIASSRKVFDLAKGYVRGALVKRRPEHDIELHLLVPHLLKRTGESLDKSIDRAIARMRSRVGSQATAVDQRPAANALERLVRRYAGLLKSAAAVTFSVDLGDTGVVAALRARAADGGELQRLIKRQRPGAPFGQQLLPRSSYLVVSDRGIGEGEVASPLDIMLGSIGGAMDPQARAQLEAAVADARKHFDSDYTLALHRPPDGGGLALTALAKVDQAEKASASTRRAIELIGGWLSKQRGAQPGEGRLAVEQRDFVHEGARGRLIEVTLPDLGEQQRKRIEGLFGPKLSLGWCIKGRIAAFVAGRGAEQQLRTLFGKREEKDVKKTLRSLRLPARPDRIGVVYLSVVDLVRTFEGVGIAELDPIIDDLKGKRVESALTLDWGVDSKRTRYELVLRLPAAHFLAFKPFIDAVRRQAPPPL